MSEWKPELLNDWTTTPGTAPPTADSPARPAWSSGHTTPLPQVPPLQAPHRPPPTAPLPAGLGGAPPEPPRKRAGRAALFGAAAIAAVAGIALGGIGVSKLGNDDTPAVATAAAPSTTVDDVNAGPTDTVAVVPPDAPDGRTTAPTQSSAPPLTTDGAPAPDLDPALEPSAAAASAVKPAVVQLETNTGLGSGFIFSDEGYILTAAHVVEGSSRVTVRLSNGASVSGDVLGTDANTDVALIKIEPFDDMPIASLALGVKLVEGQTAIAIGSPFGLQRTVTAGIVSAVNRPVQVGSNTAINMIQTDAPINSGNSGGPLIDLQGRVIGINDQIRTTTGENSGIGFAIPIDIAFDVGNRIITGESLDFGFLGVRSGQEPGFGQGGALVTDVTPESPADSAGVVVGDVIFGIDGDQVTSFDELFGQVRSRRPGDELVLDIRRNGEEFQVSVTLG